MFLVWCSPLLLRTKWPKNRHIAAFYAAPSFWGISSRSSVESMSMTLPTSAVFLINSFAPAYNIRSSLLHVIGR